MSNATVGHSAPPVRVDMLGPLRLSVGGDLIEVPGPKRRALLALLAKADGRAVPVDDLLDGLWGDDLPDSARATLHSHVSRLRSHLGVAATRLEGLDGAYRLRLEEGGTDIAQARSLLAAARASDPSTARRLLGEARSLWRGEPLAEFADVAQLAAQAVTLGELRRTIEEGYVAAALDAGDAGDAVEVAAALVAADRLSERAVLLLMRALDAGGRAAEALRAGYDHRRRLAGEAGLDPTPALAELEGEIAGGVSVRAGGVPRPANRLRGRDSEIAALNRLLADERLVTVLGPGGVGKTRLAAEIAGRAEHATALLLAPVTQAAAIPHALAAALDLRVVHGDVLPACAALLAAGPRLLLIDNCEHLLAGVRDVVATLLDTCLQLTVLATSREPLGLAAEQRLRVAPLALTSPQDIDDLAGSPAVAVFIDRARRVRPGFAPGPDGLGLVAEIVRRLDGMPLAIELAAGQLSSLGLADLHARLERSLDLLGDGRGPTLRRTIEWSYDLLPEHERRLLRHLGVFPDGFDLATSESVAAGLGLLGHDAAEALAHLVDASMVEAALESTPRYRMLDTIRSFARDRLEAGGEGRAATELFLGWALELVEWLDHTVGTADERQADCRLRHELANLRAAWRLIREHGRLDDAVRMAVGLGEAAGWRDLPEVWAWQLELANDPAAESHPDGATVLGLAAESAWSRGELDRADALARRGLELPGEGGWWCHAALALVALSRGDLGGAAFHGIEAAANANRPDQSLGVAALATAYQGDLHGAVALNDRLTTVAVSPTLKAFCSYVAGEIDGLGGRTDRAEEHYERAIALSRDSGATFVDGIASVGLLTIRSDGGRVASALDGYRHLIDYWERTGGWIQQWTTLRNLARLLRRLGDDQTAAFLEAAADSAPDAPAASDFGNDPSSDGLATDRAAEPRVTAAATSRADVLDIARQAIERHRPRRVPQRDR